MRVEYRHVYPTDSAAEADPAPVLEVADADHFRRHDGPVPRARRVCGEVLCGGSAARGGACRRHGDRPDGAEADYLPALEKRARDTRTGSRVAAVRRIGMILQQPGISYERPLECLSAKATLAGLATKDADPAVRAEASAELGKVAQGGAVIRR